MKFIDMSDRFARGLAAGLIASLFQFGLNLLSFFIFNMADRRYYNWASALIFNNKAQNFAESTIGALAQIGWATGLMVIFSYLIAAVNSKNLILKGFFYGAGSWFLIMAASFSIGLFEILEMSVGTAISMAVTSSIWGMTGAWILGILDRRYDAETEVAFKAEEKRIRTGRKFVINSVPSGKPLHKEPAGLLTKAVGLAKDPLKSFRQKS